jgi:CubicO group peptidase (beta-lactamase class C family)
MGREHIPGLAVGVYSRGQILLAKGYGLANVELNVPVRADTIFQSGSVGKQFVSAAVMMLVEEGKVGLDDSIVKYFPNAPESWKPILIKNLLSHTSGLAEYEAPERTGPKGPFYMRLDYSEDELVNKIEELPIEFKPGEKWNYRNTNYVLLGVMIHKLTGKFYANFLQERIFRPWYMNATRLISETDIIPNRSSGYTQNRGKLHNQEWVSPTFNSTADGTLYFNVLDLAKWDEALYGASLLRQSSLDRIWAVFLLNDGKPNPAHYGFGWEMNAVNGRRVIEHGGAWQGFTCDISRFVDDGLTVAVLTNLAGARPGAIAHAVAALVNPSLKPPPPKEHKEIAIDPKLLDGYAGKYELAPGFILTITREGDHLNTQAAGQGIVPIFPESEREFFVKSFDAQITFVTDSSGRATEIILHQNGDRRAKRVE